MTEKNKIHISYLSIGFCELLFKNSINRRKQGNKNYSEYDEGEIIFYGWNIPK